MTRGIVIRNANVDDIEGIMDVEHDSFEFGIIESRDIYLSRIKTFPQGFFVAHTDNLPEVIGYVSSERWEKKAIGKYDFTLNTPIEQKHMGNGEVFYISSIGVLRKYQGMGIGKSLYSKVMCTARSIGCKESVIIVGTVWLSAIKIYKADGFKEENRISDFFTSSGKLPYDGIFMSKKLL